jgi:NAD(P)-dependent dehydrogenase (short-subunit alcohol dehydrogenase family)
MTAQLDGRTLLVTGANGGLGEQFVQQALERGAKRVYASARHPKQWNDERIETLTLDLTDPDSIFAAARAASDVDLVVNNAGIAPSDDTSVVAADADVVRRVFETNFFGTLRVAQTFAPVLAANGGGAILNVLSLAAWIPVPTAYAASKAAMWSATNALRVELASQNITVTGLLVGMVDTPMSQRWNMPKVSAQSVVAQGYDGAVAGVYEVLADADSVEIKTRLSGSAEDLNTYLAPMFAAFQGS